MVSPRRAQNAPEAAVIWLHGMGVDNNDFAPFPDEILDFGGPVCRFVLPNAPVREISAHPGYPLRAWYDVRSDKIDDNEDRAGIRETAARISLLITDVEKAGIPRSRIFLGGFSQGAAAALYAGLREEEPVAGIVALSGYLPLAGTLFSEITPAGRKTPVFMAHGLFATDRQAQRSGHSGDQPRLPLASVRHGPRNLSGRARGAGTVPPPASLRQDPTLITQSLCGLPRRLCRLQDKRKGRCNDCIDLSF